MTPASALALFATLAALRGASVLTVAARAAASGFGHGALGALGIVLGDTLFIRIAAGVFVAAKA